MEVTKLSSWEREFGEVPVFNRLDHSDMKKHTLSPLPVSIYRLQLSTDSIQTEAPLTLKQHTPTNTATCTVSGQSYFGSEFPAGIRTPKQHVFWII